MTGSLRNCWEFTPSEVWEALGAFGPDDLFAKLFEAVDDYLSPQTPEPILEQILNDPAKAREAYLAIKGTDFASETDIAKFLETVHGIATDCDIPGLADRYANLTRAFLRKYNLRYRLDDPFKLRFLLPGSFTNLYSELQRLNAGNAHLVTLMDEFEHAFDPHLSPTSILFRLPQPQRQFRSGSRGHVTGVQGPKDMGQPMTIDN